MAGESSRAAQNLFKLASIPSGEDRFTAAWGWLLTRHPNLAQDVAVTLCAGRSELLPAVQNVADHPSYNLADKPDFRIRCTDFDLVIEHKLDAWLSVAQLQRYLAIQYDRPSYVALISTLPCPTPEVVLDDPRYLRPEGKPHFRWSDLYSHVERHVGHDDIGSQFLEWMDDLGMRPYEVIGPEDVFDLTKAPEEFCSNLVQAAESVFEDRPKARVQRDPSRRGIQIRGALDQVSLLYLSAENKVPSTLTGVPGPVLAFKVFELIDGTVAPKEPRRQSTASGIEVQRVRTSEAENASVETRQCRTVYGVSLNRMLSTSREATIANITEVLRMVRTEWE